MSMKNSILSLSEPKKAEFLDIFIIMSIYNFMLNWVEHEKFYNLGACFTPGELNGVCWGPDSVWQKIFHQWRAKGCLLVFRRRKTKFAKEKYDGCLRLVIFTDLLIFLVMILCLFVIKSTLA